MILLILGASVVTLVFVALLGILGVVNFYSWILYLLEKDSKSSLKYLLYALLLFIPFPIYVVFIIEKLGIDILNIMAIVIFIFSAFIGLSVFLLFVHFALKRKIKNSLITLLMGGVVFLFFAPSTYFSFFPIYKEHYEHKKRVATEALKGCQEGNYFQCREIAELYQYGEGVEQNYEKSVMFYKKASDNNISCSAYILGGIYEKGEMVITDFKTSTHYYKKSCELNYMDGCMKLVNNYFEGKGIDKNVRKAEALSFKYCIGGVKKGCSYYLNIHPTKSKKRYSTEKEFNGELKNDVSSWSRAFSSPLPENITIIKSLFKSSSSLGMAEYFFYFKIKMSDRDREIALSKLKKDEERNLKNPFSTAFIDDSPDNYVKYKEGGVSIWVDKKSKDIYLENYTQVLY